MLRSFWTIGLGAAWTAIIYGMAGMTGILTLGRLSHLTVNTWAGLWGRGMLRINGVRLRVVGRRHISESRARVLILNHTSFLDMVALCALNPPGFMALVKKEFARNPVVGLGMWGAGMHFIDRKDRGRARASMQVLALRLRRESRTLAIFPEGTRSRDGRLQPFKKGAFHLVQQTGVPLVPVVIYGAYELSPPGRLQITRGEVTLVVHPERPTDHWSPDDVDRMAAELHDEYARWVEDGPPPD